jgi:uncharacterized protein YbjT (DUF2867 family)
MKIVVIGGTGLIGSKVVEKLKQKGHEAIAAAPTTGVNTITFEDQAAMEFFQTAGRNLTAAEVAAGVRHHVALSVVGTERLQASGYFRAKLTQENHIKSSPIPYTLVRATQFFEFVRAIAQFSTDGNTVRAARAVPADGGRRCLDRGRRGGSRGTGKRHGRDRRTRHIHSRRTGPQGPRI